MKLFYLKAGGGISIIRAKDAESAVQLWMSKNYYGKDTSVKFILLKQIIELSLEGSEEIVQE